MGFLESLILIMWDFGKRDFKKVRFSESGIWGELDFGKVDF